MIAYGICVIGAGSAGLSVAAAAAQFGESVVLIEKGEMGGECLNAGCVPSKALIEAAARAQIFRSSDAFGIGAVEPRVDFAAVRRHVKEVIAAIAPNDSQERFEKLGVRVVRAPARFIDAETVEAGGERIAARRFVVATGSRPAIPPVPGIDTVDYFTNETVFDNGELPRHLLVLGGGPIGLELAQAYRRFGAEVTVVEALKPLGKEDPELAAPVLAGLAAEGVRILSGTAVTALRRGARGIVAETPAGPIEASHLLVAAGRKANVEGLCLEAAGIAATAKGITVDSGLRTANRKVYAIGDVAGGPMFTHAASEQAGFVIRNALFRLPVRFDPARVPRVTFTDPELAQAGLTEAEARARHGDGVRVLRWPFAHNDRAQTARRTEGLVKAAIGSRGRILGVGIAGPHAGELLQPWILAMERNLPLRALAQTAVPYPLLGEVTKRAAVADFSHFASNPWVRRVIAMLRRFG